MAFRLTFLYVVVSPLCPVVSCTSFMMLWKSSTHTTVKKLFPSDWKRKTITESLGHCTWKALHSINTVHMYTGMHVVVVVIDLFMVFHGHRHTFNVMMAYSIRV